MNAVKKIAALLVKIDSNFYFILGVAMMQILKLLNLYPSMDLIQHSFWFFVPVLLTIEWACRKFYGDQYAEYTKNTGNCGPMIKRGPTIPDPDTYFYQTIILDIGAVRRIAGYFYVIDKIIMFCFLGAGFHFAGWIIFQFSFVAATKH